MNVTKLSAGFCNSVYKVELDMPSHIVPVEMSGWLKFHNLNKKGTDDTCISSAKVVKRAFVVKVFSELAKLRQMEEHRGVMDVHVASMGLAPRVVASTVDMIIHEYFRGRELTEDDFCDKSDPFELGESIATKLARVHTMEWPEQFGDYSQPMLWLSIDRMIKHIEKK